MSSIIHICKMKCCQEVKNTLLLTCIMSFFSFGRLEKADPQNDTRIYLQNGPTSADVQIFSLHQVKDLVNNDKFDKNRNTTVFFLDYYSSQLSNTTDFVDGYYSSKMFNLLEIYYAPKGVSKADLKDPDVEQLTPLLADWLMELSENIPWQDINILAYAQGVELTAYVLNNLRNKSNGELIPLRVTLLDPPKDSKELIKKNIVTVFCDAIHTNAAEYGTGDSVADVDFYPNTGYEQPACLSDSDPDECSRKFAWRYWTDTIQNREGPYYCGVKIDTNNLGSRSPQIRMGIDTDWGARGVYFVETNADYPFAQGGDC